MIQNQLRIILINGTGEFGPMEGPADESEAQRLLLEEIQRAVKQREEKQAAAGFLK